MNAIVVGFMMVLLSACSSVTTQPQTIKVRVLGWVKNPGVYVLPPDATVVGALDAAGGFRDIAPNTTLRIVRKVGGQEKSVFVRLHYESGKLSAEFQLLDGDIVYARERFW